MIPVEFGENIQLNNIDRANRVDFREQLRGLGNFMGADKVFYDDLGYAEKFTFYKGGARLVLTFSSEGVFWEVEVNEEVE